jgi:hypothetical protein
VRHTEKWRLALEMIDEMTGPGGWGVLEQVTAAGGARPVVTADAGYGDATAFRAGVRLIVQPWTAYMGCGRVVQELFLDGVLVKPGDGAQPSGHGGTRPAVNFQFAGEGLDVGAADREQRQGTGAAPASELAKVEGIGLAGQAAVPGQEPGEREPLGLGKGRLDRNEGGGRGCGGHQAPPGTAGTWRGWAAAGPSDEWCPQGMPQTENELRHDL